LKKLETSNVFELHKWSNTNLITKILLVLFAVVFTWIIAHMVLSPTYQWPGVAFLINVLGAVGISWILLKYSYKLESRLRYYQIILVFVFLFAIQLFIAFALQISPIETGWDPQFIYKAAIALTTGNNAYTDIYFYFERNSNNLGLLAILATWFKLWRWTDIPPETLTVILNVAFMNASLWLLYLSARRIHGEIGANIALAMGVVFITLSSWVTTFYSDSVGLLFPIATLYLYIKILDSESSRYKVLIALLAGILLGVGFLVKPTIIIVAVAIVIVFIMNNADIDKRRILLRGFLYSTVVAAFAILSFLGVRGFMLDKMKIQINSLPESHFIMIGLKKACYSQNSNLCLYGAYNEADAVKYSKFGSMDEYRSYTYSEIKKILAGYGIGGYLEYLSEKGAWVLGDGTFYAYGEGAGGNVAMNSNFYGSSLVKDILHIKGAYYEVIIHTFQIIWFAILILLLLPIYKRAKTSQVMLIIYLSLFGILLFTLIFEGRSRYLYLYVPLFILGAVSAIKTASAAKHKTEYMEKVTYVFKAAKSRVKKIL